MEQQWYALQVRTGSERRTVRECRRLIPESLLPDCFVMEYERKKRYQGSWHVERALMFPGYVFLATEQVEELFFALKKTAGWAKILGDGSSFIPLYPSEVAFLRAMGGNTHLAELSEGYIEGDRVVITTGPMEAFAGRIRRIDRHKRLAVIETELFGRTVEVKAGLEIVRKMG